MQNHRWRGLVCTLVLIAAAAGGRPARAQMPGAPKLVVVLVVDQMRADYVDRYSRQWTGGLKRLVTGGAVFKRAGYPYPNTVTCSGHATISTGTFPSTNGIVGNQWFDREAGASTWCSADPAVKAISYANPIAGGHSAAKLLVPTLSDEMRAQLAPPARVVTFSMKERTAVMLAGHRADAATWFNAAARGFVTSTAYSSGPVAFVEAFLTANPIERDFGRTWTRALPAAQYRFDDDGLAEKPANYWTRSFPHELKGRGDAPDASFYDAWETSPFSDAYLGRLGVAAVDALKLGRGPGIDYLGISFSALDLVGHDFGPTSHEVQDVLVRLDQTIGALLAHLDRTVGAGRYVVAFTGDHGTSPIPEQAAAFGLAAGRLSVGAVRAALSEALQLALGAGLYDVRMQYGDVYLDQKTNRKLAADAAARDTVVRALRALPGVSGAYFGESLSGLMASGDHDARAVAFGYYSGRSGDLIVVPKPYWLLVGDHGGVQPGSAASHGTPYDYDQRVPLILFGTQIKAGEYLRPVTPADLAPTLAFLCGVTLPKPDGEVLTEAVAPAARPR